MINVNSISDIPNNCQLAVQQHGGTWLCYMPGDALPAEPAPTPEEIKRLTAAPYADAVQSMLDAAAQARSYDDILSMVSYAGDTHPKFGPEGAAANAGAGTAVIPCR